MEFPSKEILIFKENILNFIERDRLIISPDCGMGLFSLDLAKKKLKVMCDAVKSI